MVHGAKLVAVACDVSLLVVVTVFAVFVAK